MTTAPPAGLAGPGTEPGAVIRQARRRQHRRWLAAGVAMIAAIAGVAAVIASPGAGRRPPLPDRHAMPASPAHAARRAPLPGLILAHAATTVVMWPVGYPLFTPTSGPPAYVDNLGSGRRWLRQIPGIIGCDCRPYLIGVGRQLIYPGAGGTTAISADLKGRPRVLGATQFFAPAAAPGHVWLIRFRGAYLQSPVRVQPFLTAGGRTGPVITLPADAADLVAGTDAGLLLDTRGPDLGLALWNPGGPLIALPYSPLSEDGFAATARLIAYGTGCSWHLTARNAPLANTGYRACQVLRVLNVVTGKLLSFAAPPGTGGWVPGGFDLVDAISPADQMIAAYAAELPQGNGRVRLYVMRLTGPRSQARAVPSSAALLSPSTAWTAKGSWLLYQGHGRRLWAYQVTSGTIRISSTPCCQYGIVATPSGSG